MKTTVLRIASAVLVMAAGAEALAAEPGEPGSAGAQIGAANLGPPGAGADFTAEARLLYRAIACGSDDPLPAELDPAQIEGHCRRFRPILARFRRRYVEGSESFINLFRPVAIPTKVVYPFAAGGDLLGALTTFPAAQEITTLAPDPAGDPRRVHFLDRARLASLLNAIERYSGGLLELNEGRSETITRLHKGELPGGLIAFLIALAVHGDEPVGLRYFRVEPDGSLRYLSSADLPKLAATRRGAKKPPLSDPDPFGSCELLFRVSGAPPGAPVRVHRHIAGNLSDAALEQQPGVIRHLESKGRVSAMAKASGYLLWRDDHARIRDYLLGHLDYMLSDSTGIPPKYVAAAGLLQDTYGHFERPPGNVAPGPEHEAAFREMWAAQPERLIPFRFGYLDSNKKYHLVVTRRPGLDLARSSTTAVVPDLPPRKKDPGPSRVDSIEKIAGGDHWRLITAEGAVHVWRPDDYRPKTAGLVIYVHGYYNRVDQLCVEHHLPEQFAASKQNALFILPDASTGDDEDPFWKDLPALLEEVQKLTKVVLPDGPVVAVAHSGGFRSLLNWLEADAIDQLVLLDALYAGEPEYKAWLEKPREPKGDAKPEREPRKRTLVIVSESTADRSEVFLRRLPDVVRRDSVPERVEDLGLTAQEKKGRVFYLRSQYEHMEIITSGKVLPVVLGLSPMALEPPPPKPAAKPRAPKPKRP